MMAAAPVRRPPGGSGSSSREGAGAAAQEQEEEEQRPMVYLCAGCRRAVGDTLDWEANDGPTRSLLLSGGNSSSNAPQAPLNTGSQRGLGGGSPASEKRCEGGGGMLRPLPSPEPSPKSPGFSTPHLATLV